jgi:hypothetical protein
MKLHPHPSAEHVFRTYRAYFLGLMRNPIDGGGWGSTRPLIHRRELWQIYLEAKRERKRP